MTTSSACGLRLFDELANQPCGSRAITMVREELEGRLRVEHTLDGACRVSVAGWLEIDEDAEEEDCGEEEAGEEVLGEEWELANRRLAFGVW